MCSGRVPSPLVAPVVLIYKDYSISNDNGSYIFTYIIFCILKNTFTGIEVLLVTRRVSYRKQEIFTLPQYLGSPLVFGGVRVAHSFSFLCCFLLCCIRLRVLCLMMSVFLDCPFFIAFSKSSLLGNKR